MKWVLTQSLNNNPFTLFVGIQCICLRTTVIPAHPWFQRTAWAAWGQQEGIMEPGTRPTVRVWHLFLILRDPDLIISFTTICLHHPIKFSRYLQLHHLQEATITTVTVNESMPIWSRVACIRSQVRNSLNQCPFSWYRSSEVSLIRSHLLLFLLLMLSLLRQQQENPHVI